MTPADLSSLKNNADSMAARLKIMGHPERLLMLCPAVLAAITRIPSCGSSAKRRAAIKSLSNGAHASSPAETSSSTPVTVVSDAMTPRSS